MQVSKTTPPLHDRIVSFNSRAEVTKSIQAKLTKWITQISVAKWWISCHQLITEDKLHSSDDINYIRRAEKLSFLIKFSVCTFYNTLQYIASSHRFPLWTEMHKNYFHFAPAQLSSYKVFTGLYNDKSYMLSTSQMVWASDLEKYATVGCIYMPGSCTNGSGQKLTNMNTDDNVPLKSHTYMNDDCETTGTICWTALSRLSELH